MFRVQDRAMVMTFEDDGVNGTTGIKHAIMCIQNDRKLMIMLPLPYSNAERKELKDLMTMVTSLQIDSIRFVS
jgi:hypothetical protein